MNFLPLTEGASATLTELSKYHGKTKRELIEALLHFAASQMERPGSWEAQGFDMANYYGPDAHADRWFDESKTWADAFK